MAKIEKASDDVKLLFEEVREETTIPQWVEFEVLSSNKQKDLYKIAPSQISTTKVKLTMMNGKITYQAH